MMRRACKWCRDLFWASRRNQVRCPRCQGVNVHSELMKRRHEKNQQTNL